MHTETKKLDQRDDANKTNMNHIQKNSLVMVRKRK